MHHGDTLPPPGTAARRPRPVSVAGTQPIDRSPTYDRIRGVMVLLVVVLHASLILDFVSSGVPRPLAVLSAAAEPLRMPALMFLAGVFLDRSLARGIGRYVWRRVSMVLWPYLVWSLVYFAAGGDLTPDLWWRLLVVPPETHLWFLLFLVWFAVLGPFVRRAPIWVTFPVFVALSAVLPAEARLDRAAWMFAFFLAGDAFGSDAHFRRIVRSRWVVLVGAAAGLGVEVASLTGHSMLFVPWAAPGVLGLVLSVIAAAERSGSRRPGVLAWTGRNTVVYYVGHLVVIKVTGAVLHHFGIDGPWTVFVVCLIVALSSMTVLALLTERFAVFAILRSLEPFRRRSCRPL